MPKESSKIDFQVGQTYPFTVNTIHDDFCELLDESGFPVYLQHTHGLRLAKGQKIQCRVIANTQKRPRIELVDADNYGEGHTQLSARMVEDIISPIARGWDTAAFSRLLLMSEVEDRSFETDCREWIHHLEQNKQDLNIIMEDCTAFMEDSDFLGRCNQDERETYEQRLTMLIELLNYYIRADRLLAENTGAEFIDSILQKLEKTGYVYHPRQNFNIMSCLLLNDASLMEDSIPRLFNIIRLWPLNIWIREPFRSTLVKVLNIYVEDNIWRVDRQDDNQALVKNLMQGIAIMLLLANNAADAPTPANGYNNGHDGEASALPNERLNFARLCVLSTYHDDYKTREVLDLGLNYLVGSSYFHPYYTLGDTDDYRVPIKLKAYQPVTTPWPVDTVSSFLSGRLKLVVSPQGIAIHSGEAKERPVLPGDISLWQNLQVFADRRTISRTDGKTDIRACEKIWEDLERDLFLPHDDEAVLHAPSTRTMPVHNVGDMVTVVATSIEDSEGDDSVVYCRFEGESEESCFVYASDIVSYMHKAYIWMFQTPGGRPLYLDAKIIAQDDDGMFRLSMQDSIKNYVYEQNKPGTHVTCSLGASCPAGEIKKPIPAISPYGESISLTGYADVPLRNGDLVEATVVEQATGTFHLSCSLDSVADGPKVNIAQAFHKLMLGYGYQSSEKDLPPQGEDDTVSADDDEADFEQNDRMLDAAYVKELVRIVGRMAFTDNDYVAAYNYLAFARALCRMIGWDSQADYYRGRLRLISLLYDFAVNDRVDTDNLRSLVSSDSNLFKNDTAMSDKYDQLRIVSFLDTAAADADHELWNYLASPQTTTRRVASLAVAYRMLRRNQMDNQANDVRNRIKDTLNLRGYESNLDTYGPGIETKDVEYKTSIVYPPDNNMRPDMPRQLSNILKAIASFLNTDGGTLYIGVNNSGAGVGLENDLAYYEFSNDRDKYQRTVSDQVAIAFGNYVKTFVHSHWEQGLKSGKWVLVVEVSPYPEGVPIDGEWFYRDDSGKRSLTKSEFHKYNARRQAGGQENKTSLPVAQANLSDSQAGADL